MTGFGSVPGPDGVPLDQIRLIGVTARGHHGVFEHERRDGQDFTIDAVLHLDLTRAAQTDDLAATVDYGGLAVRIADIVRGEPVDLIETLAARIAAGCLEPPGVYAVDVFVHKPHAPITEPFTDVVIAIRRERNGGLNRRPAEPVGAVLALGTNLGDRLEVLRAAVQDLMNIDGVQVETVSPVVETDPVGGPEQPDYLNAVVLIRTALTARELLAAGQRIEAGHGRERTIRWGPRTLDVDLIRYGDLLSDDPVLELPHPRAAARGFVLVPWLAADPQAWLPTAKGPQPVSALLAQVDRSGVRDRPDLRLLPAESPGGRAMTPARILTAVLVALVSVAVCWVGLDLWTNAGQSPPPLPWSAVIGTVALVLVVIAAGLPVRNWMRGKRDRVLDPLVAARTAVLAKTAAYGGAVMIGWYVSQSLIVLPDLVGDRRQRFFVGLVAAVAALALSAAGFIVQRWCRLPPPDEEDPSGPVSPPKPPKFYQF